MFHIQNLSVEVEKKEIIHGLSLRVRPGEIHAIMGPNGSGKSTLANTIMGHPKYTVTGGEILMGNENLVPLRPHKRAQAGVFLAFQYPKEIPGVPVTSFLQMAVNGVREARCEPKLNPIEFRKLLRARLTEFALDSKFLNRAMNDGFSGGEKKKMEILQMALLEPKLCVLDETDSGLDVDALRIVAEGVKRLATQTRGILLITHYMRILHYVRPHFVHVMMDGKIVKSGGAELAEKIEKEGYDWMRPALI